MELQRLQREWDALGKQDPLWAILTVPSRRGGRWDLEEFLATGRHEVEEVLRELANRRLSIKGGRALDFGCGVGRLTQALAQHFDSVDGVDVAASMISGAERLNVSGERVRFHHNHAPDLRIFDDASFDFVLSLIVLQHMEPGLMTRYMQEFLRVLRPGGVAFFNIPERFVRGEELPEDAWRAGLTLIGDPPELAAGRPAVVAVKVRNTSPASWPTSAYLHLADRWRTPDGVVVDGTSAWTPIDTHVGPGDEVELYLHLVAPSLAGEYVLILDLVQDGIGWFADRGSSPLELPVVVPESESATNSNSRTTNHAHKAEPEPSPRMEMYVMARDDVVTVLEDAGGLVLDLFPRDRCGRTIPSVDYVVSRPVVQPYARRPKRRAVDPDRSGQRGRALAILGDRADLVGFRLHSRRALLGRVTALVRGALRRAMLEVLHRQSEFNRASEELISSLESQIEELEATIGDQINQLTSAQQRIRSLELKVQESDWQRVRLDRRLERADAELNPRAPGGHEERRPE